MINAAQAFTEISITDYLEGERESDVRHEYLYGQVYAMAGASPNHNIIVGNIQTALNLSLSKSPCIVYASDMKLRAAEHIFYYPDIMVVCENDLESYYQDKPCVIVEVLSESTARKDKYEKLFVYQNIPSLQLYLLVDSRKRFVKGYYQSKDGWQEQLFETGADTMINFPCVGKKMLDFRRIYAKTSFLFE